jgi:hypothetical protein
MEKGKNKTLSKILIKSSQGLSTELQRDLAYNGADSIYERQKIRMMDTEFSEFFERIGKAGYTLKNIRKRIRDTNTSSTTSHNQSLELQNQQNIIRRDRLRSNRVSTSILNEKRGYRSNPYSPRNTQNTLDFAQNASIKTQKPKTSFGMHRKQNHSKISQSRGSKRVHNTINDDTKKFDSCNKIPRVFKDMKIQELNRHEQGIMNLHNNLNDKKEGKF